MVVYNVDHTVWVVRVLYIAHMSTLFVVVINIVVQSMILTNVVMYAS